MMYKRIIIATCFMLLSINGFTQDQQIELGIKATVVSSSPAYEEGSSYLGIGYLVEANYYFNRKLSAGVFYSRSVFSDIASESYVGTGYTYDGSWGKYQFLQYGVSGKITTSRERFFQIYATARVFKMENIYDFTEELDFVAADKGIGGAAGFGIVLRFSRSIGFNLFDVSYNHYLTNFDLTKSKFSPSAFQIRSGLIINFLDRK